MAVTVPATRRTAPAAVEPEALRTWVEATLIAALSITAMDAVLLQQRKSFFTGGFLTSTYTRSIGEAAGFLGTSLVVDGSAAGVLAALALLLFAGVPLTRRARHLLVTGCAVLPLVFWDVVNYSLLSYLGDAVDVSLLFDLTGRSASEMFAVASSHLLGPGIFAAIACGGLAALVWRINRPGLATTRTRGRLTARVACVAAGVLVAGSVLFGVTTNTSELIEDGLRHKASGQLFTVLSASLTDFDRDGYGMGGRTSDPAPFDAAIFPYALDIPRNGIDEDGIGGDLASLSPAYSEIAPAATPWRRRPDVVLFVLESFRADAVGRRIGGRPVTPVIDALAADGVSSSHAYSHNGYTTQSRFHLMTGGLAGLNAGSLIDDFKSQGYETAYFSAQDESFGGPALSVGFERSDVRYDARDDRGRRYSTFTTAGSLAVSHVVLRERIAEFLRKRQAGRPLFLYVNFHDAHFPYHHRDIESIVSDRFMKQSQIAPVVGDALREMYYNTTANVDRAIGATIELVRNAARRAPAVIVTADHGESLFDEGFLGHGYALNDEQTRIPLVVRGLPMEISEPFGQADLRREISAALSRADLGDDSPPHLAADPDKVVFQYLGNIQRPRQIGFASGSGRLLYDFRDRRVILPDGRALRPDALSPDDAAALSRLVNFWERMMLARDGAGAAGE